MSNIVIVYFILYNYNITLSEKKAMPSLARFQILGHVGKSPEEDLASTDGGVTYVHIGIAVNEYKNKIPTTTWFKITMFGETAIRAASKINKGDLVMFNGKIGGNNYTDKKGVTHYSFSFTASEFFVMKAATAPAPAEAISPPLSDETAFNDEVPFCLMTKCLFSKS